MVRSISAILSLLVLTIALLLCGMVVAYAASTTVQPTTSTTYEVYNGSTRMGTGNTADEACINALTGRTGYVYDHTAYPGCYYRYNGSGPYAWGMTTVSVATCPAHATMSNPACICDPGYEPDTTGTSCIAIVPCPSASTVQSSGLFDIGTDPNRIQPGILNGCAPNTCGTVLGTLDPISRRGLVSGIYHYYAVGVIVYTGSKCTAGTPSVPTTTSPNLHQTCAPGEVAVTSMAGVLHCYKDGAVTSGQSGVPSTTTTASTTTTGTTTTTDQATGTTSTQSVSSVTSTSTTSSTTGGAGGSGTNNDLLTQYCAANPTAQVCTNSQASSDVSASGVPGLYDGKLNEGGHNTIGTAVDSFKTRFLNSSVGKATAGFFTVTVAGGTCPVWSSDVPMLGVLTFDFYCQSTFQNLLPWIKAVMMVIFSIVAFRIAIL